MSVQKGEKIFAAPHERSFEVLDGHAEQTGPIAFLWRSFGHSPVRSRLVLFVDEGVEWCRDDAESKDALTAARKLFLSVDP